VGAKVQAFDPVAMKEAKRIYEQQQAFVCCTDKYSALKNAEALVICTEWQQFRVPDFAEMAIQFDRVDLKENEYGNTNLDEFILGDLRDPVVAQKAVKGIDEVYQLAADMGGAGYVFTGDNDADVMYNSSLINLNILNLCKQTKVERVFYSSSACIYPIHNQEDPNNPLCSEASAYPANPDSEYGWEKLFSERLYMSFMRNCGLQVRVARFHNIFGEESVWQGGKEKAPAALCRKVVEAQDGGTIEIWGDGKQTRSFLYIDECLEGVRRLMESDWKGPVNIGSEEMVSINDLAKMII
jgi:nucleoside-diphosphate-sugar epimerase